MDDVIIVNGFVRMVCHCDVDGWHIRMPPNEGEYIAGPYIAAMLARIHELEATLKAQVTAAKPKRMTIASMGEAGVIFADIRAAFVKADGSICRTVNGAILQPGTALYVLGDMIE